MTQLDARYGRTPGRRRAARWWAIAVAIAVAVTVVLWVVWAGLFAPAASIESNDAGFTILNDSSVEIEYEVTAKPGSAVSCAIESLNDKYAVIGWKVVDLPVSDQLTRQFTDTVRTSEPAVVGLIYRCWLT